MDETRVENLYLGHATAYGYAKAKGYEGTEEEFAQLCADLGIDIEQLENMTVIINMLEPDADPSGTYSDGVLTLNLPRGVKGDTGESAYEYAVAGGYTGTEEEFQQLCADLGIEVDHLENMTVVVNMVAPSVQPSATYVDGTLTINIQSATAEQVSTATDAWLAQNITNPSNPPLDRSLTLANAATPADITGELKSAVNQTGLILPTWEYGRFVTSGNNGKVTPATKNRIRTKDKISIKPETELRIEVDTGYNGVLLEYADDTYIGPTTLNAGTNSITVGNTTTKINLQLSQSPLPSESVVVDIASECQHIHVYVVGGAVLDVLKYTDNYVSVLPGTPYDIKNLPADTWCFTSFATIRDSFEDWPVYVGRSTYIRCEKHRNSNDGSAYYIDFITPTKRFSVFRRTTGDFNWFVYNDTDDTLSESGVAADAEVTGSRFNCLEDSLFQIASEALGGCTIGAFDASGDTSGVTNRVRSPYQRVSSDFVRITCDESLEIRVHVFTTINPLVSEGWVNNWGETNARVSGGKYFRILARYKNDTSHVMTQDDVSYIQSNTSVIAYTDKNTFTNSKTAVLSSWRIGGINASGGNDNTLTTNLRTTVFIKTENDNNIYLHTDSNSIEFNVAVYTTDNTNTFEYMLSPSWTSNDVLLPQNKYLRLTARYSDNRQMSSSDIETVPESLFYLTKVSTFEERYSWLRGKTVAIFGDSISTTGQSYVNEESQVPEIIITDEDVNEEAELKVWLTYRDFHPYANNGVPPEDTSAQKPCDGITAHDLILGGVTYSYEFTSVGDGGDNIPYVVYTIDGVTHRDVLGQQEYSFTPTESDIGKHFGQADNHNSKEALPNWWQLAQKELNFIPLNACFSGSCVSRARNLGDDEGSRQQQHGSHAWNLGQIRRCGRRIPGTMNRESPDVIIIYRGTNDYGSPQNGQHPRVDTDILDTNQNLQTYFEQNKDLVGIVRENGTIVPVGSTSESGDRELYGFTEAYLLTIMRLQKAYPFAKIFCCTLDAIKRTTTTNNSYPLRNSAGTLAQWNSAIRKVAEFTGCGVIDFGSGGFNFFNCQVYYPEAKYTGVHPYRDGQVVMGNMAIADLKAQYSPMFNDWNCIKDLLDDPNVVACDDDTGFPTDDPRGAYQYVQGKIKAHCIWDGETTIG